MKMTCADTAALKRLADGPLFYVGSPPMPQDGRIHRLAALGMVRLIRMASFHPYSPRITDAGWDWLLKAFPMMEECRR